MIASHNATQRRERQIGSRTRRLLGRLSWPFIYSALVLAGALWVITPEAIGWSEGFIASPQLFDSPIHPGDHLQMSYYLWLWSHSITTFSHLPWADVFQFAATGHVTSQPFGWPLVLIFVPIDLVMGPIVGYNALVWLAFLGSAWATYALVRELGCSRAAGAVAGFAFAFAPFRLVQATGHVNALLAPLLPLMLLFIERSVSRPSRQAVRSGWLAALTYVSILGSGEGHLVVYATVLLPGYLILRVPKLSRERVGELLPPAVGLLLGAGMVAYLEYRYILQPSMAAGGRTLEEAAHYAPRIQNLLPSGPTERYAYLGFPILLSATIGVLSAFRDGLEHRLLKLGLAFGCLGALALALGPGLVNHPDLQRLSRALPLLGHIRVPGRIIIVVALAVAVLAAFGVNTLRRRPVVAAAVAAVLMVWIVIDAPDHVFSYAPAAYNPMDQIPEGASVLDLPPFQPGHSTGSIYTFLITRSPGSRVGGYSPFVTPAAQEAQASTHTLATTPFEPCKWREIVEAMGVEYVLVHLDLYGPHRLQWDADGERLVEELNQVDAFELQSSERRIMVYRVRPEDLDCPG